MLYKVESPSLWFIVEAQNKRRAYSEGVREYGRGMVSAVSRATKGDIEYYMGLKGKDAIESSCD